MDCSALRKNKTYSFPLSCSKMACEISEMYLPIPEPPSTMRKSSPILILFSDELFNFFLEIFLAKSMCIGADGLRIIFLRMEILQSLNQTFDSLLVKKFSCTTSNYRFHSAASAVRDHRCAASLRFEQGDACVLIGRKYKCFGFRV